MGPGGWRRAPQLPQHWMRSSPAAVPSQKNLVSGVTTGRRTSARRRAELRRGRVRPGRVGRSGPRPGRVGRGRIGRRRIGRGQRGRGQFGRAELEQAEHHRRDRLGAHVPGAPGGDEPAFAERGPLRPGHPFQAGAHRELLAGAQVPVVLLLAVGGDDRGETGLVEYRRHQVQRIAGLAARAVRRVQAAHGPDLCHRRRRDEAAVRRLGRELRVGVDRAGVADRLSPVADHRQVHRVAGQAGAALAGGGDPRGGRPDRGISIEGGHAPAPLIWAPAAGRVRRWR